MKPFTDTDEWMEGRNTEQRRLFPIYWKLEHNKKYTRKRAHYSKELLASPTRHVTTNALQNQKSHYTCNYFKRSLNQSACSTWLHRKAMLSGCPKVTAILIQEKAGNALRSQACSLRALSHTTLSLARSSAATFSTSTAWFCNLAAAKQYPIMSQTNLPFCKFDTFEFCFYDAKVSNIW